MNTQAAPTTVTVTTKITTTTATETGTPAQAAVAVDQKDPADTTTSNDGSPGPQRKSGLVLVAALLGLMAGLLGASLLVKGCASPTETSRDGTVFSETPPRKLKFVDVSRCDKEELQIIAGGRLVSLPECTTIVYEDK